MLGFSRPGKPTERANGRYRREDNTERFYRRIQQRVPAGMSERLRGNKPC